MTNPDDLERAVERLEAIVRDSANETDVEYLGDVEALRLILSANREMRERVEFLEDNLLVIAEKDRHYRSPPKPKPDGGLRGWSGHHAVWALTGQNGSYVGDDEVKTAVMEARSALTTQRGGGVMVHSVAQEGSAVPSQTGSTVHAVCMNKGGDIDPWATGCLVPGCTSEVGVACRNPNRDARA